MGQFAVLWCGRLACIGAGETPAPQTDPLPEIEDAAALTELLRPYPADEMIAYRVNPIVNKAGNEGAECVEPV